ncbi:MAG: nucleotidyltransferase family protein [Sedimentisphaerales bacterium]|nr:nucleotidyltransferase family protein [Sedimentisphaerales bacterium]
MANQTLTKELILQSLQGSLEKLQSFGISTIGLFGSFAREQAGPDSDIDILAEFDTDKKTYDNFIEACFFLEELFDRKIELVTPESLSPYIKQHVMKEVNYVALTH